MKMKHIVLITSFLLFIKQSTCPMQKNCSKENKSSGVFSQIISIITGKEMTTGKQKEPQPKKEPESHTQENKKIKHTLPSIDLFSPEVELYEGMDADQVDSLGRPLLYQAIVLNDLRAVILLIKYGADLNKQIKTKDVSPWVDNARPLMVAAKVSSYPIIYTLLQYGANPLLDNGFKAWGSFPDCDALYFAQQGRREERVQKLLIKAMKLTKSPKKRLKALEEKVEITIPNGPREEILKLV